MFHTHRLMTIKRCLVLLVAIGLMAPAAEAKSPPSYKQLQKQVRELKKSRDTWRRRADGVTSQLDDAQRDRDIAKAQAATVVKERDLLALGSAELTKQVTGLGGSVQVLQGQVADLTGQRDRALSGLPAAISAVPLADFTRLVFTPARAAWPCDSFYSSGSYWSYSFDSPGC
jgi:hypothetical protein